MQRRATMLRLGAGSLALVLSVAALVVYLHEPETLPRPVGARYQDPTAPVSERVRDLMTYMTLEEKVAQLALVEKNSIKDPAELSRFGIGALLSGAGAKPDDSSPQGWRDMIETFYAASRDSRLGIPILYGVDAVHGHANVPGATVFPHAIALGAANDSLLTEAVARATARELAATGIVWSFSPTLDLPTDIRWGRVYEAFSDDPVRASVLGRAYVRGLQGTTTFHTVAATAKHFIGLGAMRWGTSRNENFRIDQGVTPVDEERLRTAYLPPFEVAVREGVASVMVGLNKYDGVEAAANRYLITEVLKGELGFRGVVVSDWYGVYEIPGGDYTAAVTALNAGIDLVMLPFDYRTFVRNVARAVERGDVPEARINDAVERILTLKFSLGLFEGLPVADLGMVGSPEHRTLARRAVSRSLVVLKNEGVLPLSARATHIRVAGSAADNVGRQSGAWTVEWQGVDGNWLPQSTSILAGIRERAPEARTEYSATGTFASGIADVGIAVVGEAPYAEGWGDREEPSLSPEDRATISALARSARRVVVVLVTGRPLLITDELPEWDAAVVAWLPGSEGAGVADVLFGHEPATATLPLPWPRSLAGVPIGENSAREMPLFPRGFGIQLP